MKKILMVMTSHSSMEGTESKTGVWLGEFTDPYYVFIDEGYEVTLASPAGGKPPVDPLSELTENITLANRRFQDDARAKQAFENTKPLHSVRASDYDTVFYPGGHGPLWDLAKDERSGQLILDFLQSGKPVALVCHGPAALIKAAALQPGFLKNKRISAFSNTEEKMSGRADHVPYKLEDRLKELGADIHNALLPFTAHVETDGLLITGQNPASAHRTAKEIAKLLNRKSLEDDMEADE